MKPIIIVCQCGKVKKFGEFIQMPITVAQALKAGTYRKQLENCFECKNKIGTSNRMIPVRER